MKEVNWNNIPFIYKAFIFLFNSKVKGEMINEKENIILAGNHVHFLDVILLNMITEREVYILLREEHFNGIKKWILEKLGCIPIKKNQNGLESIRDVLVSLEDGKCLGIFLEEINKKSDSIILPFKLGTVTIAKRSKTNIIPFAITGKYRLIKNDLTLTLGKEINVDRYFQDELLEKLDNDVKELILRK